jgi:hypothetical protein
VGGALLGVLTGRIDPDALGQIKGLSIGGGLLGLGWIIYHVIRITLREGGGE